MHGSVHHRGLHRFSVLTAFVTLILVAAGGLVTSHEAGMAVPDWPNSYGYNMFLFPFRFWNGGIFYEHSHRLIASVVGLLTIILACWIYARDDRRWMRWLGWIALAGVVGQGVLGGLRVVLKMDHLGIFHAGVAQLFFCTVCALALFTSARWIRGLAPLASAGAGRMRKWFLAATVLIFLQLMLGASMRHQHAGLAVPDFPLAYGKVWPRVTPELIEQANSRRMETKGVNAITAGQIHLHMTHRVTAAAILVLVLACAVRSRSLLGRSRLTLISFLWAFMILVQAGLGAWTVWSNKAADIATAHVVLGALSLALGVGLTVTAYAAHRTTTGSPAKRQQSKTVGEISLEPAQ